MKLAAAIYLALQSLAPSVTDADEPPSQRQYRLTELSHAVASAVHDNKWGFDEPTLAGMLVSLSWHETKLASYVWEGCLDRRVPLKFGHCDPSPKTGMPQSLSYFQLKRRVCPELFHIPQGTAQATEEAARCAARALVGAWYRCRSRAPWGAMAGAFSGYGYSIICNHPSSRARAYTASWLGERIRSMLQTGTSKSD